MAGDMTVREVKITRKVRIEALQNVLNSGRWKPRLKLTKGQAAHIVESNKKAASR